MWSRLIAWLPAGMIRWVGQLQFRIPILGPVLGRFSRRVLATEGVIRHGIGSGLRFDARGGTAGFLFGTSEPHEQAALDRFLQPGDVFYDIGANVGFFATLAARLVGAGGMVYAFEPNPACALRVKRNAALNSFSQVEVVEAAVSSESGRTRLKLGHITGASTIMWNASEAGVEVALISVDDFIRDRSARGPTVVMIDAEGAEIRVLEGMQETIRKYRPVIMCEVHWIGEEFLSHCHERLIPLGYTVRPLKGGEFPTGLSRFHALLTPNDSRGVG